MSGDLIDEFSTGDRESGMGPPSPHSRPSLQLGPLFARGGERRPAGGGGGPRVDRENTEKEGRGPLSLSRRRCCKFSARMAFFGERGKAACAYSILTWERRLPPTPIQRRRRFQGGEGERESQGHSLPPLSPRAWLCGWCHRGEVRVVDPKGDVSSTGGGVRGRMDRIIVDRRE